MLASHLNNLIADCVLKRFSLIKVKKLFLNNSKTKKIVVIVGLECLKIDIGKRLGAPIALGADCKIPPALASTLQKGNSNAPGAASKGHACIVANQDQPPIKRNSHPVPCDGGQLIVDISGSSVVSGTVSVSSSTGDTEALVTTSGERKNSGRGPHYSNSHNLARLRSKNVARSEDMEADRADDETTPVPCDGGQLIVDISGSGVVSRTGSVSSSTGDTEALVTTSGERKNSGRGPHYSNSHNLARLRSKNVARSEDMEADDELVSAKK